MNFIMDFRNEMQQAMDDMYELENENEDLRCKIYRLEYEIEELKIELENITIDYRKTLTYKIKRVFGL